VGQVRPLMKLAGTPLLMWMIPESCQPPMIWLAHPETPLPRALPRPKGSYAIQNPLN